MTTTKTNNQKSLYERLDEMSYILANEIAATIECDESMYEAMKEISDREFDEMTKDELIEYLSLEPDASDEEIDSAKSDHYLDGWTIYQTYIVNEYTHEILKEYGQLTWYNEDLNAYFWGVTHYGTSWSMVMNSIYPV